MTTINLFIHIVNISNMFNLLILIHLLFIYLIINLNICKNMGALCSGKSEIPPAIANQKNNNTGVVG